MQPTPTLLRRCAHSYEHNPRQSTRLRGERAIQGPTLPASTLVPTSATLMRQSVSQFQFTLRQNKPYFILFNHLSPIKCSADAAGRLRRRSSNAPPTPLADHCDYHERSCAGPGPSRRRSGGLRGCRHWDGHGSANTGGSAPSGMGTNASSANPGPSAPPGIGTRDVGTGANLNRTSQTNSPDVQPTTSKSRAAAQAKRTACAGHAQNGLPIGAFGTGTSNEEQMIVGPSPNRKIPAAKVDGNIAGIVGRGSSLSDQVSRPRAARTGEKVLDAAGRQSASPTANDSFA